MSLETAAVFFVLCADGNQIIFETDASEPAPAGPGLDRQNSFTASIMRWRDSWPGAPATVVSTRAWNEIRSHFPAVAPAPGGGGALPEVIQLPGAIIRHIWGNLTSEALMSHVRIIATFRRERTSFKLGAYLLRELRPCRYLGNMQGPPGGAIAVAGITLFQRHTMYQLHGWGPGDVVEIPAPAAFCSSDGCTGHDAPSIRSVMNWEHFLRASQRPVRCWLATLLLVWSSLGSGLLESCLTAPGPNSGPTILPRSMDWQVLNGGKGKGWQPAQWLPGRDMISHSLGRAVPETLGIGLEDSHGKNTTHEKIKKRSLKRAYRRLALHGFAMYRGQLMLSSLTSSPPTKPAVVSGSMTSTKRSRKRFTVFCWNAMALNTSTYAEMIQWVALQRFDVAFIQSTHWSISEPWSSYVYSIIPSPELSKDGGGLLIVVRTGFCTMDALSYQDLHHGRLLHVRCHLKDHCIDLVNLYQFPVGPTAHRPHPLKARHELWTKLTSLLRRIPARHTLVIGGDFNTTIGHGPQPGFPDASRLQEVC